jgi:hypothetical protein
MIVFAKDACLGHFVIIADADAVAHLRHQLVHVSHDCPFKKSSA